MIRCFGLSVVLAPYALVSAAFRLRRACGPGGRDQIVWIPQALPDGTGREHLCAGLPASRPAGPFRVAVINHGVGYSSDRLALTPQGCDTESATWFTDRGFMVVFPLRRGYGQTGGVLSETSGSCELPDYVGAGWSGRRISTARCSTRRRCRMPAPTTRWWSASRSAAGRSSRMTAGRIRGCRRLIAFAPGRGRGRTGSADRTAVLTCWPPVRPISRIRQPRRCCGCLQRTTATIQPPVATAEAQAFQAAGGRLVLATARAVRRGKGTRCSRAPVVLPSGARSSRDTWLHVGLGADHGRSGQADCQKTGMGADRAPADRNDGAARAAPAAGAASGDGLAGARSRHPAGGDAARNSASMSTAWSRAPLSLNLAEFMALPQTDSVSDMHCVTQWSRYDNHWQGVAAHSLIDAVRPRDEVSHVVLHAHDGYTTNLRLEQFDQPDVFLVHRWEGQPIDRRHGGPVRVMVPRLYLWKSAKWIRRIAFIGRIARGSGRRGATTTMPIRGAKSVTIASRAAFRSRGSSMPTYAGLHHRRRVHRPGNRREPSGRLHGAGRFDRCADAGDRETAEFFRDHLRVAAARSAPYRLGAHLHAVDPRCRSRDIRMSAPPMSWPVAIRTRRSIMFSRSRRGWYACISRSRRGGR